MLPTWPFLSKKRKDVQPYGKPMISRLKQYADSFRDFVNETQQRLGITNGAGSHHRFSTQNAFSDLT
jgi:hypothetical protein